MAAKPRPSGKACKVSIAAATRGAPAVHQTPPGAGTAGSIGGGAVAASTGDASIAAMASGARSSANAAHPAANPAAWSDYRCYVASVPGPKIVVVQDLQPYAPGTPDYGKPTRWQELGFFTNVGVRGSF